MVPSVEFLSRGILAHGYSAKQASCPSSCCTRKTRWREKMYYTCVKLQIPPINLMLRQYFLFSNFCQLLGLTGRSTSYSVYGLNNYFSRETATSTWFQNGIPSEGIQFCLNLGAKSLKNVTQRLVNSCNYWTNSFEITVLDIFSMLWRPET